MRGHILHASLFLGVNVIMYCFVSIPLSKLICASDGLLSNLFTFSSIFLQAHTYIAETLYSLDVYDLFCRYQISDVTEITSYVSLGIDSIKIKGADEFTFFSLTNHNFRTPLLASRADAFAYMRDIFEVRFIARKNRYSVVNLYPLQDRMYVLLGETSLASFRIQNPTRYTVDCITIYVIHPEWLTSYFTKIQCFCFEPITVGPKETLDLPVLFFLSPSLRGNTLDANRMSLLYILFSSPEPIPCVIPVYDHNHDRPTEIETPTGPFIILTQQKIIFMLRSYATAT